MTTTFGIPTTTALPSTPANEWAQRTNESLATTQGDGVQSPGPYFPGAYPEDCPGQHNMSQDIAALGETLIQHAKAILPSGSAGYFGVGVGASDAQLRAPTNPTSPSVSVGAPHRQDTDLSTTSSASAASGASIVSTSSAPSSVTMNDSPRAAGYSLLSSTPSVNLLAKNSMQSLAPSTTMENAPVSTVMAANADRKPYLDPARAAAAFFEAPADNDYIVLDANIQNSAPFTPIPPVRGSAQYFPVSVAEPEAEAEPNPYSPLLTHAGTHARGHTEAEDAQRAVFLHDSPKSTFEESALASSGGADATSANGHGSPIIDPAITASTAAAGHVFTAYGVHTGTTLGAAQVAHAGAFVEEKSTDAGTGGDGGEVVEEQGVQGLEGKERKKEHRASVSRLVAKMKENMHVAQSLLRMV
ncbi:hypothetical protein B0H16DRAFT_1886941 [Mycena metata]|uniref:Uncharacterized protein n=1 Tax=Mycena metata TaxID=1033252 RepID=A0AAD7J124_9AGAR|nr:hypothetical protein B0H16DRAFT_1886941 [Mycena metata]